MDDSPTYDASVHTCSTPNFFQKHSNEQINRTPKNVKKAYVGGDDEDAAFSLLSNIRTPFRKIFL
jgi:hypothetical protein